ncbi:MAG: ABC transporter substrate-binding protein [Candidatus Heimdallarchaeota archaeon]|nr:ABC transporter substrate-binding protein [Candidatus Heimdallarchaeota archaeon]
MKERNLIFLFILALLIPVSGSIISVSSAPETNEVSPDAIKLAVSTRHDAILYNKLAAAFASSTLGASVGITSASQIKFSAPSTYDGFYKEMTDPFFAKSVAWGGGPTLFNNLAAAGALSLITDTEVLALVEADIPDRLAGADMKKFNDANELVWVGSAISSFGFTVNNAELEERGLPKPKTWEDLASPEYYTFGSEFNIGLGNAPDTTSNTRIYQIILQKFGWEKGWEIIYRMAGNGKIFGGSVETRSSVITGDTAIAMTIDFYGVIAMTENPNTEYIVPENGSIVNADPIALSKNPAHPEAANAFIKYVLSKEGQAVLFDAEINRLPIRADAFTEPAGIARPDLKILYDKTITNKGIDFDEDLAAAQYSTMRWHFEFTIQDVYLQLRDTWGKMVAAYREGGFPTAPLQRFDQIAAEFGKPAITMAEALEFEPQISDAGFKLSKQTEWNQFSSNKFTASEAMIDDPYTITTTSTAVITSDGTTTTSEVIVTSSDTGSTASDTTEDVPLPTLWLIGGMFTPILIIKVVNKRKKLDQN